MFGYKPARFVATILGLAMIHSTNGLAQEDPYLWLEDVNGDKAISWVKEQNAKTQKVLEASP